MAAFGPKLDYFRKRIGISLNELAVGLNIHRNTLLDWRDKGKPPNQELTMKLAKLLILDENETNELLSSAGYASVYVSETSERKPFSPTDIVKVQHMRVEHLEVMVDPMRHSIAPRYFMTLHEYLTPSGPRFPTTSDFERDLVYLPEKQMAHLHSILRDKRHALLVGHSAAGKTVLAIALAKQLQEMEGYEVFYNDAGRAPGNGLHWWSEVIHANDRKDVLYVLDNCHRALEYVNDFCFQWAGKPPEHAQFLLISRPHVGDAQGQLKENEDYFDMWADTTVIAQPEKIYWGMIEKYAAAYRRRDPSRYVSLENDFPRLLKNQHSHNLLASRSRLEAWYNIGGQLSQVNKEAVYKILIQKYLSHARETLPLLCALRQYEIPVHNRFISMKLSEDDIKRLEEEKFLTSSLVRDYGVVYELVFHPEEAREIFEADIYRQLGYVDENRLVANIAHALHAYLCIQPPNYIQVYESLARQGHRSVLRLLLTDTELQDCAASQFETGSILETVRYLLRLLRHTSSPSRVDELLRTLNIQTICSKILKYTSFRDMEVTLRSLLEVDRETAIKVVGEISMEHLAQRVEKQGARSFFNLVQTIKGISHKKSQILLMSVPVYTLAAQFSVREWAKAVIDLQHLKYPAAQLEAFVKLIDMQQLVEQTKQETTFLRLYQLIHALNGISQGVSPTQLDMLIKSIPVQPLIKNVPLDEARRIIECLQGIEGTYHLLQSFIELLDMERLTQQAKNEGFYRLSRLIHVFKSVSPLCIKSLFSRIPVQLLSAKALTSGFWAVTTCTADLHELQYLHLETFIESIDMKQFALRVGKESFHQLIHFIHVLMEISPLQAKTLLASIPIQVLADKASRSTFGAVANMIVYAQKLSYPEVQLQACVELIDMAQLPQRHKTEGMKALFRLLLVLYPISPTQVNALLTSIPTQMLATKATERYITRIVEYLEKQNYPQAQLEAFAEATRGKRSAQQLPDTRHSRRSRNYLSEESLLRKPVIE